MRGMVGVGGVGESRWPADIGGGTEREKTRMRKRLRARAWVAHMGACGWCFFKSYSICLRSRTTFHRKKSNHTTMFLWQASSTSVTNVTVRDACVSTIQLYLTKQVPGRKIGTH
jgi:hypothetical protein